MAVPPELRTQVLLELSRDDLISYFEGTQDPLINDPYFWSKRAAQDFGITPDQFINANPVEATIPTTPYQRWIQILSRDNVVKGSQQFLTISECVYRAIKDGRDELAEYFLALPEARDKDGNIKYRISNAPLYAGLEMANQKWVDFGNSKISGTTAEGRYNSEDLARAMGRGGSIRMLPKGTFEIEADNYAIGIYEGGYNFDYNYTDDRTPDSVKELATIDNILSYEGDASDNGPRLGYILARKGDLDEIRHHLPRLPLNHIRMIVRYAVESNNREMFEVVWPRFVRKSRPERPYFHIKMSAKPSSLLAEVFDQAGIGVDDEDYNVYQYGFTNRATYEYTKQRLGKEFDIYLDGEEDRARQEGEEEGTEEGEDEE